MTIESALALFLAMLILVATPGPGVFATVARALSSGFRAALYVVAGMILGDMLFLMLAIFGLSAIARTLGEFFFAVKLAGGAYLIWMGWKMWRADPVSFEAGTDKQAESRSRRQNFLGGLLITLGNPKVILFYIGFLPTFMDLSRLTATDIMIVAGVVITVLSVVMGGYAYSAARARRFFSDPGAARRLNRGAGTVMIGTGVAIATR